MILPLTVAVLLTLASLLLCLPLALLLRWRQRPLWPFWRAVAWLHLGLLLLHLFVSFPLLLGLLGSRGLGTRPGERSYAGPRLDAAGVLLVQDEESLLREARGERAMPPAEVLAAAAATRQWLATADGLRLRAFRLPARQEPPVATWVLVHGLFRCAVELEPVAAMLRDLGCECWLVDLRNHGGSDRAPFRGGLGESEDVLAAVAAARAAMGDQPRPLLVYGVSLGTLAVAMALPRLDGLAGLVLDAPMEDLTAAAHRLLSFRRARDQRSWLQVYEPWRSLVLAAFEAWSDFRLVDVSPGEVLANLPLDLPVLLIGGEHDDRAPPATVERLFQRLPMAQGQKELWLAPGSGHGKAFHDHPREFASRLAGLLGRLRR